MKLREMLRSLVHAWLCIIICGIAVVYAQDQTDFISIDCGIEANTSYTDKTTGINYVSDANFIETGENKEVSLEYDTVTLDKQLLNLRIFPQGNRHCYTLKPARGKDDKYLIRATFLYGNYDGKGVVPEFDIYLGVNLWDTVKLDNASTIRTIEIIHNPPKNYIYVCLVNTGAGIPFISSLELRLLKNTTYTGSFDSLVLFTRIDAGSTANRTIRFKDDAFDRIWKMPLASNFGDAKILSTSLTVDSTNSNSYQPPRIVMSSAVTMINASAPLEFFWDTESPTTEYYVFLHFAELELLQPNQSRAFNISANGEFIYGTLVPDYLFTNTIYSTQPISGARIEYSLYRTEESTLPPILNGIEIYEVKSLPQSETDGQQVDAILNIKSMYEMKRNWQGDPCSPNGYPWDGLNCSYNDFNPPNIISLNLASSGLKGEIAPDIAILTSLQQLDLSNNSLSGQVPDFLSKLTSLEILNLKGNNLTGSIPAGLVERSQKGLLTLSVDETIACTSCTTKKKKKNIVVPVVLSVTIAIVLLVGLTILWIIIKRRKQLEGKKDGESKDKYESLEMKNQHFTFSDVLMITNKFQKVLGEGGFGKVYLGNLENNQVAVKILSESSAQGYKEFQAEVKLLMRVHHKNLTALVGYCNEGTNKALIYEYMANGSLRMHLSDKSSHILTWEERMRISIDSAQGLEYLHKGCKPPIVHRDVKSTNILLNEKIQAKLADFGLSRAFPVEGGTHVSTVVAGTPGYLDPEYYASNWLSEKSDVYSFGIVLLEIITGRAVITYMHEKSHIAQWVMFMLEKGDIHNIVDSKLRGNFNSNSAWKAVEIAMYCVSDTSSRRPDMTHVVTELKECLKVVMGGGAYDGSEPKYSGDLVTNTFDSEMAPSAR